MKLIFRAVILVGICSAVYFLLFLTFHKKIVKYGQSQLQMQFRNNKSSKTDSERRGTNPERIFQTTISRYPEEIVVAVVVCGDRLLETLVMLKSAIFFTSKSKLRIIVVTEPDLILSFDEKLSEWRKLSNGSFEFETHKVSFPKTAEDEWKKLFKPCASQRLFFPIKERMKLVVQSLLKETKQLIYVDTDVLFLSPLEEIWSYFYRMNSTQFAVLAAEHEDPNTGWYNRFAKHPYYGKLGVNSGVMLMDLKRMREFQWESYLSPIYKQYRLHLTWGDQDIINIIFHFHPERLLVYDCRYNFRSDHCMYMPVCREAVKSGVRVLHGSRGTFHSEKQPAFKAVFTAMDEFQIGADPYQYLLLPMETYLQDAFPSNCGKNYEIYLSSLKKYITERGDIVYR